MNKYFHHIGDFNAATKHLTRQEASIYLDLIHRYYDQEEPIMLDISLLARKLMRRGEEAKDIEPIITTVLDEFFIKTDEGYFNERCEFDLEHYRKGTSKKSKAGIASGKARKKKAKELEAKQGKASSESKNGEQVLNENKRVLLTKNQEPRTNNQEPYLLEENFEKFWCAGMLKVGSKKAALSKFKSAQKASKLSLEEFTQMLCDDIAKRVEIEQFGFDKLHPTTYLNQERWNDEQAKGNTGNKAGLSAADRVRQQIAEEFGT